MKKTILHRLLAFALALCFLVGGAFTVSAANESVTNATIDDYKELLGMISYEAYKDKYIDAEATNKLPRAEAAVVIQGSDYDPDKTTANVTVNRENGTIGTPDLGAVTWTTSAIKTGALYSIVIEYYPDVPAETVGQDGYKIKSASIERILKINGEIPFAEARYVTLPKVWRNAYVMAKVEATKDVSVDDIYAKALAAGFAAEELVKGDGYVEVAFPDAWTAGKTAFVNEFEARFFTTDIDDNEIRPTIQQVPEWRSYEVRDIDGFYAESFEFAFIPDANGEVSITLEAVNEPMTVKSISLIPHENYVSYENYLKRFEGVASGQDNLVIQAEFMSATSTQTVYPIEDRTDAATQPADTSRTVLNTIGGEKWQTSGQWVSYTFKVNTSGMYNIGARYRQNVLDGMYVNRALYIYSDGAEEGSLGYYDGIPFTEASELRFNYNTKWQSTMMNNGTTDENGNLVYYSFYFEEGVEYTVEMMVTVGSMGDIVRRVQAALDRINDDYLSILKLTGASPDEYRDYGFSRIMPDVMVDMILQSRELTEVAAELEKITGEKSSNVATLERVADVLYRMGSDEDEIAKYLDQLKSYIGSLGTWLGDAKTQPLQLDCITVQPVGAEAPRATAGFFAATWHEIKSFVMSFFRNYDRMGATSEDMVGDNVVDVWIATGRDQAQVLRNLINNDFTPNYGISVNLSLVAGGALLPSVLAGMGPDVYIGVSEDSVINYAIRGALMPVDGYDGFAEFALQYEYVRDENGYLTTQKAVDANGNFIKNSASNFNEAAMIVLGIENANGEFHYYGLPETQGFNMMFVRTDVLADLDIEIPKTWDDVLAAVPVLQANNMEIGMHTDYKVFLYQMGGELFADEGMRINLDSDVGLEAFDTMCSYFTMYSFPYSYDFANRFRTGEMPIGFASYTGTYNHLTVFATEIKGLWQFFPLPGIASETEVDENGDPVINNVAVSAVSAICMMNGCNNEDGAWAFMKWHSGKECQVNYSNEMVAIIGPSAKHSTANLFALEEMPWTRAEYEQLSKQYNSLASIPNYPGSYIIGRYTNFAFLAAYNDNKNPVDELRSYITTINKEITRKRAEFGLETLELGQTLLEKRFGQMTEAYEADVKELSDSTVNAASNAYTLMQNGIKRENVADLKAAAAAFAAVDANGFAATVKAINAAVVVLEKQAA